jgi:diguanylate cyclase (GGDEF)-like protein
MASKNWVPHQLMEFLSLVSDAQTPSAAMRSAVERAAEALEAEVGAIVVDGLVAAAVGFPFGGAPEPALARVAEGDLDVLDVPGIGECPAVAVPLDPSGAAVFVVARSDEPFERDEMNLLRGMGRALSLSLKTLGLLEDERRLREKSQSQATMNERLLRSLQERQQLLEKLSRIQRSISSRAPLKEVLDSIVAGANELIGDDITAILLRDPEDLTTLLMESSSGVTPELREKLHRRTIGEGAGGRAVLEDRVVVIEDYTHADAAMPQFQEEDLQAAMAAPVRENGIATGSLIVASYKRGRTYSRTEREILEAFAEHASLALTDAKTLSQMQHQAFHDALTGLPNRALFLDRLAHALARRRAAASPLAVLFLDLDRFKVVNDSLGHGAGDQILVAVAERLKSCLRPADTAARLGGDEFAILVEDMTRRTDAVEVAERLQQALRAPFEVADREVFVSASIGIASSGDGAEDLLRDADAAMYRAKGEGKGRYQLFEPGMQAAVLERLELEADLQRAIERNELLLQYQPINDLSTHEVVGVEALVRWQHPTRGLVPPLAFIPLAEETGLILPIGRWVMEHACRQAALWQARRGPEEPLVIGINLSARQLQEPGFACEVAETVRRYALDPPNVVLEITETVLMDDSETIAAQLAELKELGVRIAIDDFGTGYSSLGYLRDFRVDILKIAKPFVDGVGRGAEDSALAQAIIDVGASLGLDIVAEGIELPLQLAKLRELGCGYGQGFYFSKPVDEAGIDRILREGFPAPEGTDVTHW